MYKILVACRYVLGLAGAIFINLVCGLPYLLGISSAELASYIRVWEIMYFFLPVNILTVVFGPHYCIVQLSCILTITSVAICFYNGRVLPYTYSDVINFFIWANTTQGIFTHGCVTLLKITEIKAMKISLVVVPFFECVRTRVLGW